MIATSHAEPPMRTDPVRITRVRRETADTFTMDLEPPDRGFRFQPGQFNMLYVFGVGEVPISISGDSTAPGRVQHTTRVAGTVTRAMRALRKGDMLGLRGPFGSHWPVEDAAGADVLLMAGGIGLAPLRPAIYRVMRERSKYNRVVLLYGTRTPDDILYRHELERWRGKLDMEVRVTVDRAPGDWRGNVGVVTTLIGRANFNPRNCVAFVCGPEMMMHFSVMELRHAGVDTGRIYISMERNMKCAVGFCGHCQLGPKFVCKDGPVFCFDEIQPLFHKREL
jgi:NAD(P)H-flavin reductase